jgi:large subunit ribosomal protein L21
VYAIIEDSGTQIKVAPGDVVDIDLREIDAEAENRTITFDRVLVVGDDAANQAAKIGTPYIEGATVLAEVVDSIRDAKVTTVKYKRRKGYRRKKGHRQPYLRVKITDITS